MTKIELFEKLCEFRVASYPLQDIQLIKDDWMVSLEEQWLWRVGYNYEEYQEWKSKGKDIRGEREAV